MPRRMGKARRGKHVYFLGEVTMKKGILDIELIEGPLSDGSKNDQSAYSSHFGDGGKSLLIINAILLSETTGDKTGFVSFYRSIRVSLDFIHPLATNGDFARRKRDKVPSVLLVKGAKLFNHGMFPNRNANGLAIGLGFLVCRYCC